MARTPQEIFEHHATVLIAGDIEGIVSDYADDALIITPRGVLRGKDGVREAFTSLLGELPDADLGRAHPGLRGRLLFIEWSAVSEKSRVRDGVDTFVFRDGLIRVQTLRHTLEPIPRPLSRGPGRPRPRSGDVGSAVPAGGGGLRRIAMDAAAATMHSPPARNQARS